MSDKAKRNIFLSDLRVLLSKNSAVLRVERERGAGHCTHWIEATIDNYLDINLGTRFGCESMEDGDDE